MMDAQCHDLHNSNDVHPSSLHNIQVPKSEHKVTTAADSADARNTEQSIAMQAPSQAPPNASREELETLLQASRARVAESRQALLREEALLLQQVSDIQEMEILQLKLESLVSNQRKLGQAARPCDASIATTTAPTTADGDNFDAPMSLCDV